MLIYTYIYIENEGIYNEKGKIDKRKRNCEEGRMYVILAGCGAAYLRLETVDTSQKSKRQKHIKIEGRHKQRQDEKKETETERVNE